MQFSFGNMTIELNIHDRDEGIVDVDLDKELIDHTFPSTLSDDPLQTCLTHFGLNFYIDILFDEVNALLDLLPSIDTNKWKSRIEQLTPLGKKPSPSLESPSELELILVPDTLEYGFLGDENTLPIIILPSFDDEQKTKLLGILREYKEASGWTIVDIKVINSVDCMYYTHIDENAKHTRKM